METRDVLADAFGRIRSAVHGAAEGLDGEGLAFRPDPDANSIAWLVWHLTRIQDDHVADIADREQVWSSQGWHARIGATAEVADTGYGHTSEQVAAVRPDGPADLLGYHDAVSEATQQYLTTLEPSDLERIIDRSYEPPVSVAVRLVSVISDNLQHAGQANYVRGIWDRRR